MSKPYEPFHPVEHALSNFAVLQAFVKTFGGEYPRLFVHEDNLATAIRMGLPFEVCVNNNLGSQEWYVENQDKRMGSLGC